MEQSMLSFSPFLIAAAMVAPVPASSPVGPEAKTAVAEAATSAFDQADAAKAVTELAAALEENFVFPDKGAAYAAMLRANLAKGAYVNFADRETFAKRITDDLQAVHKDGHVRLQLAPPGRGGPAQAPNGGPREKSAVERAGWLADGIAYIDFRGFPGNEATIADVRKFLAAHAGAKTLIIDARRNGGGGLAEMNLIFEQVFAKPTTLVTMDIRQAVEERHGTPFADNDPLMPKVDGPATIIRRQHLVVPAASQGPLKDAKVILLTSKKTFSAAEHLSLALKRTGRATLIGEATGGGAHFGGTVPMGEGYAAFIPVGRTFDPDTGESWEGTGVAPSISIPADKALDEALRLSGIAKTGTEALAEIR
jgi:hypothetical protein